MRVVVQRAIDARCIVDNKVVGSIDNGLMLLVGFTDNDTVTVYITATTGQSKI